MNSTALVCLLFCVLAANAGGANQVRETPLQAHVTARLSAAPDLPAALPTDAAIEAAKEILARPDPETFFSRYVFGLQRDAAKLLTSAQATALDALIARYAPLRKRWHDERNTLRCKFNEVMWRYAATPDEVDATALRAELRRWMEIRMEWTLRENLCYHELDRAVWGLLDAAQRRALLSGEWKGHAKLTTGHERASSIARGIAKALGDPDDPAAYAQALDYWEKERKPLHHILRAAEHTVRRAAFAMDLNSLPLVRTLFDRANFAYASVYLSEAEALRRIIRAGYSQPGSGCERAAAAAWAEAPQRFRDGAADLISLLETPASAPRLR